jgi:hypothetical protein
MLDIVGPDLRHLVSLVRAIREGADHPAYSPSPDELIAAGVQQIAARFENFVRAEVDCLSSAEAAEHGWSRERIESARESHQLVALRHPNYWIVPRWQFDDDFVVRTGVAELLNRWPASLSAFNSWMLRPNPRFEDEMPVTYLNAGRWRELVEAVESMRLG